MRTSLTWTLGDLHGSLRSWSATARCLQVTSTDPSSRSRRLWHPSGETMGSAVRCAGRPPSVRAIRRVGQLDDCSRIARSLTNRDKNLYFH